MPAASDQSLWQSLGEGPSARLSVVMMMMMMIGILIGLQPYLTTCSYLTKLTSIGADRRWRRSRKILCSLLTIVYVTYKMQNVSYYILICNIVGKYK